MFIMAVLHDQYFVFIHPRRPDVVPPFLFTPTSLSSSPTSSSQGLTLEIRIPRDTQTSLKLEVYPLNNLILPVTHSETYSSLWREKTKSQTDFRDWL